MKLPNFLDDAALNELRARMGATELGSYRLSINPYRFTVAELEELIHAGIDIKYLDEVRPLPDRTLAYKNRRVVLYAREVPVAGAVPRYHVADCRVVRAMRTQQAHGRLTVSAREDGEFPVDFIEGPLLRPALERLLVCESCLRELSFAGFSSALPAANRTEAIRGFTLTRFFERYRRNLAAESASPASDALQHP